MDEADDDLALLSVGERRNWFEVYRWPPRLLRFLYEAVPHYYTATPLNLTS
jgi:hypothetical protein